MPDQELRVGRRRVRLTSPDKLLFPGDGVTKRDLADYYAEIGAGARAAPARPAVHAQALPVRHPRPALLREAGAEREAVVGADRQFRTWPREGGSRLVDFALVNEPAAAVWMVQMNCIDMNAWYSRVDKPERPDYVVFDLDPPESRNGFAQAIEVAHLIRAALGAARAALVREDERRGRDPRARADHAPLLVPSETYEFAELVSRQLEAEHPGLVTTEWLKKKRRGVLVDHRQNGHGKTIASAYSVRPKPGAPVSTPLRWEELGEKVRPRDFGMREALARVERHGDLFEPVLRGGQALGPALRALRA